MSSRCAANSIVAMPPLRRLARLLYWLLYRALCIQFFASFLPLIWQEWLLPGRDPVGSSRGAVYEGLLSPNDVVFSSHLVFVPPPLPLPPQQPDETNRLYASGLLEP